MRAAMIDTRPTLVCMASTSSALRTTRGDYRQPERPVSASHQQPHRRRTAAQRGTALRHSASQHDITPDVQHYHRHRTIADDDPRLRAPAPASTTPTAGQTQPSSTVRPTRVQARTPPNPTEPRTTTPTDGGHNPRSPRPVPPALPRDDRRESAPTARLGIRSHARAVSVDARASAIASLERLTWWRPARRQFRACAASQPAPGYCYGGGIDPMRAAHEAAPVGPVDPARAWSLDPDPAV